MERADALGEQAQPILGACVWAYARTSGLGRDGGGGQWNALMRVGEQAQPILGACGWNI